MSVLVAGIGSDSAVSLGSGAQGRGEGLSFEVILYRSEQGIQAGQNRHGHHRSQAERREGCVVLQLNSCCRSAVTQDVIAVDRGTEERSGWSEFGRSPF